ncbi:MULTISPECIES: YSC84-related protein [Comamonas]|uniref:Twin-arginine translocation pathway signal n=1 Tax=Comamonas avium TaxID=2762231 RepID=A0ABR8SBL1_9BURK|nr:MULTISPECIES: YSC84-related protein [Comamonas]MBD7960769.1 twin-arginine translocation pathway signal [Comamonas avium]MBD9401463.1 twin-arginine translocation pathway signal [Comamonas sp. CMM02]
MQKSFSLRSSVLAAAVVASVAMVGCTTTGNTQGKGSAPDSRAELESQATAALTRLYSAMPGTRELVAKSKGVLVCPAVIGGSFVIGAEHGKCVLRSNGTSRGYYSTTAASVGWQAGGQSKAVIYVFNTQDAYNKFVNSDGWSVGADATVAVGKAGANGSVDTATANAPISSYVLTNTGLEAGVSVQGAKISKIKM